ncbi:hypothetical protein CDL62_15695 [Alkalitalea saponilacus]|nr:hypothetical protein CDL62_14560 [Alkalitalea saponilacus]ASB50310.1 hypothetical protein CDL62_14760 [Alkalitalea saponilacus]ASB50330.1 hypothetical protein CDL62_14860 [Alkalitalea saponilacus]ASB50332.1 hypothetical protein CDL62_14870 [Alkalitalea saponilacus]ASB50364.1 hypothetical protein CDL62_15030 [Alkalitalea saponilacus]
MSKFSVQSFTFLVFRDNFMNYSVQSHCFSLKIGIFEVRKMGKTSNISRKNFENLRFSPSVNIQPPKFSCLSKFILLESFT